MPFGFPWFYSGAMKTQATQNDIVFPRRLRTVIADRDRRFVSSLSQFIGLHDNLQVVGIGIDGDSSLSALARAKPDLVLLGLTPVHQTVLSLLQSMRMAGRQPRVIGMVDSDADIYARAMAPLSLDIVLCRTEVPALLVERLGPLFGDGYCGQRS